MPWRAAEALGPVRIVLASGASGPCSLPSYGNYKPGVGGDCTLAITARAAPSV